MIKEPCKECYANDNRITPLLNPIECLKNHTQYICGECGRCICIEKDSKRHLQRWNFPFKSLEIAKLYLRTADYTMKTNCGIYEILSANKRKFYKIFPTNKELEDFLLKNKDKSCINKSTLYKEKEYKEFNNTNVRLLNNNEIEKYMKEKNERKNK